MRFNSVIYWLFLPAVVLAVWMLPAKWRKHFLLGASYLFYASWHWPYLALLFSVGVISWAGAHWISRTQDRRVRGGVIIAIDLVILAVFKYFDWLPKHWVVPLGLSFFLFESMSYTIDVVRKREKPHPFWDIQLFIVFFPKLIAGPILRAKELLPQLAKIQRPDAEAISAALRLIVSGLFLKVVIADGLAPSVDKAFARSVNGIGGIDAWMMAIGFGLQIYLDFSSYSRIAIGSAKLLGIELVENFNHPYVAKSPPDFWNRWHMSLSRWIRDYLFYPLVGKKSSLPAMARAAIGSMVLCGAWHGAGWTFVFWGLWHGLLIAGYHVLTHSSRGQKKEQPWWSRTLGFGATFLLVMLGWIFFRATNLGDAFSLIGRALTPFLHPQRALGGTFYLHVTALALAILVAPRVTGLWTRLTATASEQRRFSGILGEGVAMGAMMVLVLVYLRGQNAFIYFQF